MGQHIYTKEEKNEQLNELRHLLEDFIVDLARTEYYRDAVPYFKEFLNEVDSLLGKEYAQEDLNRLSDHFRPIMNTHRDWVPPDLKCENGTYVLPEWYDSLEKKHEKIRAWVGQVKSIGFIR